MKKAYIITIILLIFPLIVHAETITYDVCENGCEYEDLSMVQGNINALGNLGDKEIIINIDSDYSQSLHLGEEDNKIKSVIVNGNNYNVNMLEIYANNITISGLKTSECSFRNSQKIILNDSTISRLIITFLYNDNNFNSEGISINEILEIDDITLNNVKLFGFGGNLKLENMNFQRKGIVFGGGTINMYNCQFGKIIQFPEISTSIVNIYNSTFESLKYINLIPYVTITPPGTEFEYVYRVLMDENIDYSEFEYDIYDINIDEVNMNSNTTVYFDKELEIKPNNKINLTEYLDYYTDDKEIDYVIEDESIAKIENKELIGLKEGQTNVTVTTDDGHVVYRIKLNVIKEIKIPLSGINIKPWVLIVGVILLGVIGICIYLLIKKRR